MEPAARRLTWLGQAGFRIELDGAVLVVDAWLSPHADRIIPSAPLELAADDVQALLVTHEHLDHLDLPFLPSFLDRAPDARVVLPRALAALVEGVVPESRLVLVDPYDTVEIAGVEIHVTPAYHALETTHEYGDGRALGGLPRFVGYVLSAGRRIYHAGDTLVTDALVAALGPLDVEVALLPINGRDAAREARGIVGNMNAREAVELALAIGARTLVPYHWDGFLGNTVPPGEVLDEARGRLHVLVPEHFRCVELEAA
jgi:L-ascorbate metabolism protein UlaG (beta-lactamase superfamily)